MRPTRCCGNLRGFGPPLFVPVHAAPQAALHGALHAASTTTGSSHVAPGEDLIAPQEAPLATSGDAAGRYLAFLDGTPSGSGFRVSDQPYAGRQRNQCRRCQKNDCQPEDQSAHGAPPYGNTWEIPNRHVGSQPSRTQEHATHVTRGSTI